MGWTPKWYDMPSHIEIFRDVETWLSAPANLEQWAKSGYSKLSRLHIMLNGVGYWYLKCSVGREVDHAISLETSPLLLIDPTTVLDVAIESVTTLRLTANATHS